MSVQKSLLMKKSDADLHKYLEAENQFVSTAILYAFEILKSRGILFDQSEAARIDALISERIKSEYLPSTDEYAKELLITTMMKVWLPYFLRKP